MEGRIRDPFDFHLNNPGIREILRAATFVDIPLGWANGAVASAAVLHTVGRGFESLIAHHFPSPVQLVSSGFIWFHLVSSAQGVCLLP